MEWHELPKYNGIQVSQLIYLERSNETPTGTVHVTPGVERSNETPTGTVYASPAEERCNENRRQDHPVYAQTRIGP